MRRQETEVAQEHPLNHPGTIANIGTKRVIAHMAVDAHSLMTTHLRAKANGEKAAAVEDDKTADIPPRDEERRAVIHAKLWRSWPKNTV